jgi:hypothetical protein
MSCMLEDLKKSMRVDDTRSREDREQTRKAGLVEEGGFLSSILLSLKQKEKIYLVSKTCPTLCPNFRTAGNLTALQKGKLIFELSSGD